MFKVNNKDTKTTPVLEPLFNKVVGLWPQVFNFIKKETPTQVSFWCFYCKLWAYFTPCSSVFIGNFEQVNASWEKGIFTYIPAYQPIMFNVIGKWQETHQQRQYGQFCRKVLNR